MVEIPGRPNSEKIKKNVELILDSYEFDRSKLISTDDGSSMLRLF